NRALNAALDNQGTLSVEQTLNMNSGLLVSNSGSVTVAANSTLSITGDFEQTAAGTFIVEIPDTQSGATLGQLTTTGLFFLDGTLNVVVEDEFIPDDGQAFRIISGASRSGSFLVTDGLDLGNGVILELEYNPANATLITHSFPNNQPPVAINDSATTDEDIPVTIAVLSNDSDPDGDPLAIRSVTQPAHGPAVRTPDGTITYTPNLNFNGTDSFTYKIRDGKGGSAIGVVAVTIQPINDAPTAVDDSASTVSATP